jgi:hypothetical protein
VYGFVDSAATLNLEARDARGRRITQKRVPVISALAP